LAGPALATRPTPSDLLHGAPDGMIVVDPAGRIVVTNRRMAELFGYTPVELTGMTVEDLLPEELRTARMDRRLSFNETPHAHELGSGLGLLGRRRDGSIFPVDVALNPLATRKGPMVVAAIRDVTARTKVEKRLAERNKLDEQRRLTEHLVQAQEEERRRIAGDIHDDPIQVMTAVGLRLRQLARNLKDEDDRRVFRQLDKEVRESVARLRRLVFDLRPASLDFGGLAPALRELAERTAVDADIEYSMVDRLGMAPADSGQVELYRIAQEALANVRKHSKARSVTIKVERIGRGVHMQITDDGVGVSETVALERRDHFGLVAIKERAQIAGGWCRLESRPGCGTTVDAWVPGEPA